MMTLDPLVCIKTETHLPLCPLGPLENQNHPPRILPILIHGTRDHELRTVTFALTHCTRLQSGVPLVVPSRLHRSSPPVAYARLAESLGTRGPHRLDETRG